MTPQGPKSPSSVIGAAKLFSSGGSFLLMVCDGEAFDVKEG